MGPIIILVSRQGGHQSSIDNHQSKGSRIAGYLTHGTQLLFQSVSLFRKSFSPMPHLLNHFLRSLQQEIFVAQLFDNPIEIPGDFGNLFAQTPTLEFEVNHTLQRDKYGATAKNRSRT
jgi:hypothetical protein